jgi:anti-sigma factor RsiW
VIGHLGSRASALLDGQLSPEESERAWEHVHGCHACRDLVEREGWVKTRLAGLSFEVAAPAAPAGLKGSLMGAVGSPLAGPPGESYLSLAETSGHRRRGLGLAAIGGGAAGAAVLGVLVLGVAPADAPTNDRRPPTLSLTNTEGPRIPATPSPTAPVAQLGRAGRTAR